MRTGGDWQLSKTDVFWAEVASDEHVVQLYQNDDMFINMLAGFAGSGFNAGDSVILIATASHLQALEKQMKAHGIHVDSLIANHQYIPLDAAHTLSQFMVNDWPDEALFMELIGKTVARAKRNNRKIRAFGEMVAILWANGHQGATIELENLWNNFCKNETLTLFCAYPMEIFDGDAGDAIMNVCSCHSRVIDNSPRAMIEVLHANTRQPPTPIDTNITTRIDANRTQVDASV